MYLEKPTHNHLYGGQNPDLYITEFGHTKLSAEKKIGPRVRSTYILHIIISGKCEFCGNVLSRGQAFLTVPGVRHDFSVSADYEHFWISFAGSKCEAALSVFSLPVAKLSFFTVSDFEYAEKMLRGAFEKYGERYAVTALFFIFGLIRPEGRSAKIGYAEEAARIMERNCANRIKITDVASQINISEKYLCRLFHAEYGMSPQKYLLSKRMEKAKILLESTDLLIREIAEAVGYPSQLTFSDIFSKYYGMSPSMMRKKAEK